jgi:DNA-binding response OmpR family regulator
VNAQNDNDQSNVDIDVLEIGELRLDKLTHHVSVNGKPVNLTPKAVIVLKLLMMHMGEVITRDQLLNEVWGWTHEHHFESRAVDLRVHEIRRKLGCDPKNPKFIETVFGRGYRFISYEKQDDL